MTGDLVSPGRAIVGRRLSEKKPPDAACLLPMVAETMPIFGPYNPHFIATELEHRIDGRSSEARAQKARYGPFRVL
jgi:hypothetical protein